MTAAQSSAVLGIDEKSLRTQGSLPPAAIRQPFAARIRKPYRRAFVSRQGIPEYEIPPMSIYILQGEEKRGPFQEDEVKSFLDQKLFSEEDLCWKEGFTNWVPLSQLFNQHPPAPATSDPAGDQETETDPSLATEKQKELLRVYGIEFVEGITKEVALALLRERDLSKPIPASAWQEYQRKFPPSQKHRTRAERVEWLLQEILEHHDTSYWSPDEECVREILDYIDHRFKGWERRVNSYDLIDRGIHAFYPPPDQAKIEGTEAKKSVVVETRKKKARKATVLEALGLIFIGGGVILLLVSLPTLMKNPETMSIAGAVGAGVCFLVGFKSLLASRRVY
jgi:hypothetical protein